MSQFLVDIKIEPESADSPQEAPVEIKRELVPVDAPPVILGYQMEPASLGDPPLERTEVRTEPNSADTAPAVIKIEPHSEYDNIEIKNEDSFGSSQLSDVEAFNILDIKFEIDDEGPVYLRRGQRDTEMAEEQSDDNDSQTRGAGHQDKAEGSAPSRKRTDRPHQCNVCKKQFRRATNLKFHYKTHTKRRKVYRCEVCEQVIIGRANLSRHLKTHTCAVCMHRFKHKHELLKHRRTHVVKPYQCEVCQQKFRELRHLVSHTKRYDRKEVFQCRVCHQLFDKQIFCSRHLCPAAFGHLSS